MRKTAVCLTIGLAAVLPALAEVNKEALLNPAECNETAPDTFRTKFVTSKGDFVIEVQRAWSPNGADRFYNLVKNGYYDGVRIFRVLEGFMAQFGINGDPDLNRVWQSATIPDDPVAQSNQRGFVTFAKRPQPNTRTTQLFINYKDNGFLDDQGFAPFGQVTEGMEVVDQFFMGYGEGAPRGRGPNQAQAQAEGNAYFEARFPKLDYIETATIVE